MEIRIPDIDTPIRTSQGGFWDNFWIQFGFNQPEQPKTAEETKPQIDWTTIAIIGVVVVVLVMLFKK